MIEAVASTDGTDPALDLLYDEVIRDTIACFEATGSPVITDGEQRKYHNFWTYCVQGRSHLEDHLGSYEAGSAGIRGRRRAIDPHMEAPEEVRDGLLEAADYIPVGQLGTCDDCGFSPFCDDTTTSRVTAFAKIRARVEGNALASERLGSG